MNAVTLIQEQLRSCREKTALWMPGHGSMSFGELGELSQRVEYSLRKQGLREGDALLLALNLSPLLYAAIIAIARMGCTMVLVEPWMPLAAIEDAVNLIKPKAFIAGALGFAWGLRVPSIRRIPRWLRKKQLTDGLAKDGSVLEVDPSKPLIVTFTSGTTGKPKGVVRTHGYLWEQARVLKDKLETETYQGPDICIFANFALINLASGRPSLVVPGKWRAKDLEALAQLPADLQAQSLVAGPAFFEKLLDKGPFPRLRNVFIGGAQTDCALLERGFARWPDTKFSFIYGGTEVEPVASGDAREAVKRSRDAGYFQTLFLGKTHSEIRTRWDQETFWVAGPHVCPEYLGDGEANRLNKLRDASGTLWHRMGDRIERVDDWLVYGGRESQNHDDFLREQRLYSALNSSDAMIDRDDVHGVRVFSSQGSADLIRSLVPDARAIYRCDIKRDKRHRSRIDRGLTKKGTLCKIG